MARPRSDLCIVAGHGDVPRCEHGRSSPTMARWENAMGFAQQPVFTVNSHFKQGLLAWQDVRSGTLLIIDKNGGLNNTSTCIGFAPERKLGVVSLEIRGNNKAPAAGDGIYTL